MSRRPLLGSFVHMPGLAASLSDFDYNERSVLRFALHPAGSADPAKRAKRKAQKRARVQTRRHRKH